MDYPKVRELTFNDEQGAAIVADLKRESDFFAALGGYWDDAGPDDDGEPEDD